MLFNSYVFLCCFLPVAFFVYVLLRKYRFARASLIWLLCCSLFFYGWWEPTNLLLLCASITSNFWLGRQLTAVQVQQPLRRCYLLAGLLFNLGLLCYFKYSSVLLDTIAPELNTSLILQDAALPLAISFFTFQQISYLVDCYRAASPRYSLLDYSTFVAFFPQLIAGPIVKHNELIPQLYLAISQAQTRRNLAGGLFLFSLGLFKKTVVADSFAVWANHGFDVATTLNALEAWTTSTAYTMQLYFDFSAYSDMAIGLGLMFNIRLPVNFDSPLKAANIQDFWRRWHITLSRFLRDYLYIPMGGNRSGNIYFSLLVTFMLGGWWHGASWNFLFWGLLHGLALCIYRLWRKIGFKLWPWFAWLITFSFVNFAFVFFRARSWDDAIKVISGMADIGASMFPEVVFKDWQWMSVIERGLGVSISNATWISLWLLAGFAIILLTRNAVRIEAAGLTARSAVAAGVLFCIALISLGQSSEFLYFEF